ncbi:MAG: universal stress protein [Verrucomicrobia bacterium]|nr:universal stress protein [Verrucomicrobiota bacterium]
MNKWNEINTEETSATTDYDEDNQIGVQTSTEQLLKESMNFRQILVPVDFSPSSKLAVEHAVSFAQHFGSSLLLLNVVEFNFVGSEFATLDIVHVEKDLKINAEKMLESLVNEQIGSRARASTLVHIGRPYFEITDVAADKKCDLIIIGSHGHSALRHILLGSTVERVIRHAHCPVLVIRPPSEKTPD